MFNICFSSFSWCRCTVHTPHLVIKVCFGPSLWPQTQLATGHLLIVVPETSDSHGQYQHCSHACHGNKGNDGPAGALGNLDDLREALRICPLWRGRKPGRELTPSDLATGAKRSPASHPQHDCFCCTYKMWRWLGGVGAQWPQTRQKPRDSTKCVSLLTSVSVHLFILL